MPRTARGNEFPRSSKEACLRQAIERPHLWHLESSGSISKVHAHVVEREPGEFYEIIDANSSNGTRVNNQELLPFQSQTLINLDQIVFGKVVRAIYLTPRGLYELVQDLIRVGII